MIWWIDAGAGASGDMLLGALLGLDPDGLPAAQEAVDAVLTHLGATERVQLATQQVRRNGLAATQALVQVPTQSAPRTWRDIQPALRGHAPAHAVFESLAEAEASVHACAVEDVHFHEVGALDAIADIVAVTTLWERLAPERVVVSDVCVGSGSVETAHGRLPVPAPAVTLLLHGIPTFAGAVPHEACTPTGAALLAFLADDWGPQPPMAVQRVGTGAGGRDPDTHPNVLRVLAGDKSAAPSALVLVETTVDDLDPRVYPDALEAARTAGALEAWITPVVMKHGRPGVVVTALAPPTAQDAVTEALLRQTTTLGVRRHEVDRVALTRDFVTVEIAGIPIAVKRGWLRGEAITIQPEYRDAQAVARATGQPVRQVLERARILAVTTPGDKKGSDATDGGDSDVRTPEN
jgi:uncharacterized protein (TIGR00299 family) protein